MTDQSRLEIVIDSRSGENNVRNLRNELSSLEGTGVRSLSNLRAAALAATGALAAIGVGVGFSSMLADIRDFSTEMASLRAVSRASVEDMERLENQARLLGATTAFGANQAAQAQRFLAQGGLEVNQILGATPQVMRLAQAGTLGLAEAADLATDVMAQLGLGVNDIERIGDVLVATAQSATTDVSQIGQALSYAGGQASDFGLSLEETVAALGLISSAGIKATRAGTGLVGTLAQLSNVSGPAEETLRSAGLSVAELDIEARGIVPVLETLAAANLSAADRIQIFGRESAAAAGALIRGLDAYREQIQLLGDVEGRAADTARTMTDHLGGAMRGLSSAVSEANLQLGDSGLTGTMRTLIDGAAGVVQVFNGMSDEWAEANNVSAEFQSNVENVASAIGGMAEAAELGAIAIGVRLATAMLVSTRAKLKDISASAARARAEDLATSQAVRRSGAELAAANAIRTRAIADARATAGTNAHAFAMDNLARASARATGAQAAHTAALNAQAAAAARANIAIRGVSAAAGLVGGPLGVFAIATAGVIHFREELGLVPPAVTPVEDSVQDLTESLQGLDEAVYNLRITALVGEMAALEQQAQAAAERVERLRQAASQPANFGQGQQGDIRGGIAAAEFERDEARNRVDAIRQTITQSAELRAELRQTTEAGQEVEESFTNLGNAADALAEKFQPTIDRDIEDILERAGPGATVGADGLIRDAFGNTLPSFQRELEAALGDQVRDFKTEQNLMAGLEALTNQVSGGATEVVDKLFDLVNDQIEQVVASVGLDAIDAVMPELERSASNAAKALDSITESVGGEVATAPDEGFAVARLFGDLNKEVADMVDGLDESTRVSEDATEAARDHAEELERATKATKDFADTARNSASSVDQPPERRDTISERARERFEGSSLRRGESSVTNFGGPPSDESDTARGAAESLLGSTVGDDGGAGPVVQQLIQANSHLANIAQGGSGEGRNLGTLTLASPGGTIDVEANAEALNSWLASTLSGAAASV